MRRPYRAVLISTDILDCEECRAMSGAAYKGKLLLAAMMGEVNHMTSHLAFELNPPKAKRAGKARKP